MNNGSAAVIHFVLLQVAGWCLLVVDNLKSLHRGKPSWTPFESTHEDTSPYVTSADLLIIPSYCEGRRIWKVWQVRNYWRLRRWAFCVELIAIPDSIAVYGTRTRVFCNVMITILPSLLLLAGTTASWLVIVRSLSTSQVSGFSCVWHVWCNVRPQCQLVAVIQMYCSSISDRCSSTLYLCFTETAPEIPLITMGSSSAEHLRKDIEVGIFCFKPFLVNNQ